MTNTRAGIFVCSHKFLNSKAGKYFDNCLGNLISISVNLIISSTVKLKSVPYFGETQINFFNC